MNTIGGGTMEPFDYTLLARRYTRLSGIDSGRLGWPAPDEVLWTQYMFMHEYYLGKFGSKPEWQDTEGYAEYLNYMDVYSG